MIDKDFLLDFKRRTEERWKKSEVDPDVYGFQFQRGTRWNPGLSENEIKRYEEDLGFAFSPELRDVLGFINGTDLPTLNVYGNSGESHRTGVGVYSYPRDLNHVLTRIRDLKHNWKDTGILFSEVGLNSSAGKLYPFYIHRFVVCEPNFSGSPVLSVYGADAILYAKNLRDYLEMEFLRDG